MINLIYEINTINYKRNIIKNKLFEESKNIKAEDFLAISESDLYILFELYDDIFLNNWFKYNFKGKVKLTLSRQLTRSAGNTKTSKNIVNINSEEMEFEIKISLNHLTDFNKIERRKYVGGIEAKSKLDSLMLVFEHELCHVIEFIIFKKSSCKKQPFKSLICNVFGQTESTHKLISKQEANYHIYGIKPGDNVTFIYKDKKLKGTITKINKNAIVMVPDFFGKYIDKKGKRYVKYSMPLGILQKI